VCGGASSAAWAVPPLGWIKNDLNTLADTDDVVGLTKRISGGTNGLAHRRELLNKANGLRGMLSLADERPA
jgi:putative chitinase